MLHQKENDESKQNKTSFSFLVESMLDVNSSPFIGKIQGSVVNEYEYKHHNFQNVGDNIYLEL